MQKVTRAVIDIGTNSVKLLVAEVAGLQITPVFEDSNQTRLGRGFYETHVLQADAIVNTAAAVAEFSDIARQHSAQSLRVIATSAARDAKNSADLTTAIQQRCGLPVEIISGEQEADWAFRGVTSDSRFADSAVLILDAGGGSTEFILGRGQHAFFRESFRLGTVRLMEKLPHSDPPTQIELAQCRTWLREFLENEIAPSLRPILKRESDSGSLALVGTGGTANILARMENGLDSYDRSRIEGARLSAAKVNAHAEKLWSLALSERQKIPGLPANRADVILTGVLIFESVIQQFNLPELAVSTRGLRFAALMD